MRTAQQLVSNNSYQAAKNRITDKCTECKELLADTTRNVQGKSIHISKNIVRKLEGCMAILVALIIIISVMIRKQVVYPLSAITKASREEKFFR